MSILVCRRSSDVQYLSIAGGITNVHKSTMATIVHVTYLYFGKHNNI